MSEIPGLGPIGEEQPPVPLSERSMKSLSHELRILEAQSPRAGTDAHRRMCAIASEIHRRYG